MATIVHYPWQVPFGALSFKLDPLSGIFLIAIGILALCAGVYGIGYMRAYRGKRTRWLHGVFYVMLVLSLVLITLANNVILFLGAWEGMTLFTYFLIVFNDEKASVRKAGFIYLIASHGATFFLVLMFFLMAHVSGSMDFEVMAHTAFPLPLAGMIFLLALIGFGVKAGFVPLHIWLPYAHPAAPSHISALMSGVTIKMGIYGICRVVEILEDLPSWCGYLLVVIGVVSGVLGVLYALGQHELKKMLAYHSIENIGIIALGLGVGLLGRSHDMPFLAVVGFGGGLLHVLNHSLFKGLLFLGVGSVIQQKHTGELNQLGGVARSMPVTSALVMIGALSICGLPVFNGFISEFMIYFGLFQGVLGLGLFGVIFCSLGILGLAFMGALAMACFTKMYGVVFSGRPRGLLPKKGDPKAWDEVSSLMLVPMLILAGLCCWIGLSPEMMARPTFQGGATLTHVDLASIDVQRIFVPLTMLTGGAFLLLAVVLALILVRRLLVGPLPMPVRETWNGAYDSVTSRFQYTSSSFSRPMMAWMQHILLVRRHGVPLTGVFPEKAHVTSSVHDASEEKVFVPALSGLTAFSKWVDNTRIRYTQMYLMYIFLFLIFLLIWKLK